MNMKKIISIIAIVLVVVIAAIRLFSVREGNITQSMDLSNNNVTVTVANVEQKSSSFTLNFTGTLYPYKELDVSVETAGKITSLNFELGQYFQKGGVIATVDDKIKKLTYESAKIEADRLKKDLDRTENLFKGGTSSEQELDRAQTSYETAKNKYDEAENQLSYTKIAAPISGTITKKMIEEGTYVKLGDPVASIVDISRLKVKINVSESSVYYLRVGDRVKITTDIYNGVTFDGRISFVSPRGDESHNYPVEVEIANSSKNPLKAGTFVNVEVGIGSNNNGLYIPREALQGSIKDAKVYVAENGKALLKNIVIGRESNESLEVVSGLNQNDKVIVSGQVNLTNNKPIKIINNN
jgi:membrane fusion protein, multidrug efflux system